MNSQDVILGMLMKRSLSGYDMKQRFETQFAYFFSASYGTIYPMLNKMEKEGLISKETMIQQGRPNKNIYTITDLGRENFLTYLHSKMEEDTYKSDFLMRLFFGEFAEEEIIVEWINNEIEKTKKTYEVLCSELEKYRPFLSPTQELCMKIGIQLNEARLKTLEEGLKNGSIKKGEG